MKRLIYFSILCVSTYLLTFLLLWNHSNHFGSESYQDKIYEALKINYLYNGLNSKTNYLEKIYSIFDFNSSIVKKESDIKLIFSKNDLRYNDSIVSIAIRDGVFSDELKNWRKAKALFNNSLVDIKYKFHGTSIFNYKKGFYSYKIKAKDEIFGKKSFVLINGNEMDYKQIFFNKLGNDLGLYAEDFGKIITAYDTSFKDFFFYERFDNEYFESNYKQELIYQFKKLYKTNNSFIDETDRFYYSIDENFDFRPKELSDAFQSYKKIHTSDPKYSAVEKSYLGKYLSLIYLFGDYHQISGYNSVWLYVKDKGIFPKFRNEGDINNLENELREFNNSVFSTYDIKSLEVFQNALTNNKIRYFRDKSLFNLISKKDKILFSFDSIENLYRKKHRIYNSRKFFIKNQHKKYRKIVSKNFEKINDYLSIGETFISIKNDTIKIISNSYTDLCLKINNKIFTFTPRKFEVIDKRISDTIEESKFVFEGEVDSINVFSPITGKSINKNLLVKIYE